VQVATINIIGVRICQEC